MSLLMIVIIRHSITKIVKNVHHILHFLLRDIGIMPFHGNNVRRKFFSELFPTTELTPERYLQSLTWRMVLCWIFSIVKIDFLHFAVFDTLKFVGSVHGKDLYGWLYVQLGSYPMDREPLNGLITSYFTWSSATKQPRAMVIVPLCIKHSTLEPLHNERVPQEPNTDK